MKFTASDYILHPLHSDDAADTDSWTFTQDTDSWTFTQTLLPGPEHTNPVGDNSSIDPLTNPSPAQVYFPCIVLQLSDGHTKILIASYWLTQVLTSNLGPEFFQLLNVAGLSGHFRGNRLQQRWL